MLYFWYNGPLLKCVCQRYPLLSRLTKQSTYTKMPPVISCAGVVHGRLQGGRFTNVINAQYCARRYDTRSDTVTNAETLSGFFADIVEARPAHVATKSTETNTGHI